MITSDSIQNFIDTSFVGAFVTITLVDGSTITGEVVELSNSIIALKSDSTTNYINAMYIASFC